MTAGFSANLFITGLDPLLAGLSTIGAQVLDADYSVAVTANWWFMAVSTLILTLAGSAVTHWLVEPRLPRTSQASAPGVIDGNHEPSEVDESIDLALLPYREKNVPAYWWVGRSSRPGDLGSRLTAHGLKTAFIAPAMAADLQTLPDDLSAPAGLVVEEVTHTRAFDQWLKFSSVAMNLPPVAIGPWTELHSAIGFGQSGPLRHFLALLGGEPAAAASLFTGSGIAGMANLITKKEYRRKGIGSALTVTMLKAARNAGFRVGALLSSLPAAGMYRRLGFREYGREWCYLWDGGQRG